MMRTLKKLPYLFVMFLVGTNTSHADQPLLQMNALFTTQEQSIWSSGEAFIWNFNQFIGPDITLPTQTIGSGAGDTVNVSIPVPGITDPKWSINPYQQYRGNFKAGLDFGANINGGSVNANLDYALDLSAPDVIRVGEQFSLTSNIQKLGSSSFQTTAANASAYLDGVIQSKFETYVRFEVDQPSPLSDQDYRLGNRGFTTRSPHSAPFYTIPGTNINERMELISINRNESGVLRYLGGTDFSDGDLLYDEIGTGSSISAGPVSLTAGNWNTNANGNGSGSTINGSAEETLVTATLDVDQLILGSAILGMELKHDWGLLSYDLGYDVLDYKANLDLGMRQSFGISEEVLVMLQFSEIVELDGFGQTDKYLGSFADIPDITLLTGTVDVDVEFLVEAQMQNLTEFTFGGSLDFTLLEAHIDIDYDVGIDVPDPTFTNPFRTKFVGKSGSVIDEAIGPFYEDSLPFDLGDITAFDETFTLAGFAPIDGGSFTLSAVPLPPAAWLLASSLAGIISFRRKRRD